MPTPGGFILPPLRGYVPGGELDVNYDLMRVGMALEVPFWEGADVPYCHSHVLVGDGLSMIPGRTTPGVGGEFGWNLGPLVNQAGAPKSGHIGVSNYVRNNNVPGGPGWRWDGVLDPVLSQFIVGRNYSVLLVGTPMLYMNPDLPAVNRANSFRQLIVYKNATETSMQLIQYNPRFDQLRWQHFLVASLASPVIPIYGRRVAMLFVNGDEGGAVPSPRVFIADEDGSVERADFSTPGTYSMWDAQHLELFQASGGAPKEVNSGGGCWEYYAHFVRSFEDDEARALCRDALGAVKWDPYMVRRVGWVRPAPLHHIVRASPSIQPRVGARPAISRRVLAGPAFRSRVAALAGAAGARVLASPTSYQRITARIRLNGQEADMRATPLCPSTLNWLADNILELAEVEDDITDPATPITSAVGVTCEIWDQETGLELTTPSPVTLSQVGLTNTWRGSVLASVANGFAENQRLRFVFLFDGGAGLQGRFTALGVVGSATS